MAIDKVTAVKKLQEIIGCDLHDIAAVHGIYPQMPGGLVNKGWAGQAIERHLDIPLNSSRCPNLGSWELKTIPLIRDQRGKLKFKETMAITMIDPHDTVRKEFEESHLLTKLRRMLVVARTVGDSFDAPSAVHSVTEFRLKGVLYNAVKADYELIRQTIQNRGFNALTGKMGQYIQPRTKGKGHGSTTRAFYARKEFLAKFIDLLSTN